MGDAEFNRKLRAILDGLKAMVIPDDPDVKAAEEELRKAAEAERRTAFPAHLRAVGAPESVIEAYVRGIQQRPTLGAVRSWFDTDKPMLLLSGSNGIGKSVAAAYALSRATKTVQARPRHESASLIDIERLDAQAGLFLPAGDIRNALRFRDHTGQSLLFRAERVRILVVDELRADDFKGNGLTRLEEILGRRHDNRRGTVITTNLAGREVLDRFSPLLASRFARGAVVFESGGSDLRSGAP